MTVPDLSTAVSLTELRYLVAVDEQRHFGRAAATCCVTQSTLSAGIKKLESTLGVLLFERTQRSVRPTPIGQELAQRARSVLAELDALVRHAQAGAQPLSGPIRLGVIPTLGPYLLPWLLPLLGRSFPALEPRPHEAITEDLLARLRSHQLDAAFLALPVDDASLVALPLFDEPFWLLTPRGHPLATRKSVRESDLAGQKVLLLTEGHCLRDQALSLCERVAAEAGRGAQDLRATSLETLRQLVAAGFGCTLLPALAVPSERGSARPTRPLPFVRPGPSRRIALLHRKTHPRPGDLAELAAAIRKGLPKGVTRVKD